MRRMISNTTRLMGMGFNKLLSESKARETLLQQKLTFVIKSLTDKDTLYTLQAYNGIKEQYHKAINANLVQNDSSLKLLNDRKFSDRILRRLMDSTLSLQGQAYVSLLNHLSSQTESQNQLSYRQRAIFRRMIVANSRLTSMGFNKLIEFFKARQIHTREKLRFVVKSLKNQESMFLLQAWNGLRERRGLMAGVGAGMGQVNKLKIIRRLMNKAFDWECQAWG
jgi:predicted ATP-dependent protease